MFAIVYVLTGLGVTVGFHRYLTHRSFATTRHVRAILAALGSAAIEGPVISWVCGFVAYEWLYQPTGLGFWSRLVAHLPTPSYAIGASVPGFVVAFLLTAAFAALGSSRAAARARREPLVRSR